MSPALIDVMCLHNSLNFLCRNQRVMPTSHFTILLPSSAGHDQTVILVLCYSRILTDILDLLQLVANILSDILVKKINVHKYDHMEVVI